MRDQLKDSLCAVFFVSFPYACIFIFSSQPPQGIEKCSCNHLYLYSPSSSRFLPLGFYSYIKPVQLKTALHYTKSEQIIVVITSLNLTIFMPMSQKTESNLPEWCSCHIEVLASSKTLFQRETKPLEPIKINCLVLQRIKTSYSSFMRGNQDFIDPKFVL